MIDFFTFNTKNIESDISLEYFIPYKNDSLILSEAIFNLSRPQANALRLLAKKRSGVYSIAQNNFEDEQKNILLIV